MLIQGPEWASCTPRRAVFQSVVYGLRSFSPFSLAKQGGKQHRKCYEFFSKKDLANLGVNSLFRDNVSLCPVLYIKNALSFVK